MSWHRRTWLQAAAWATSSWALPGCRPARTLEGGWVGQTHERGHTLRRPDLAAAPAVPAQRCEVLIIGAGIAGLSCARQLLRSGLNDLRVIDLEDRPGGNSRGHQMGALACPLGAHYLPLPGPHAVEVIDMLHEWGLGPGTAAREEHLCHSPQERVWVDDTWHEGLLPPAEALPATQRQLTQAQYHRFAQRITSLSTRGAFTLPAARSTWSDGLSALDAITFAQWLDQEGFSAPALRWYLDYCCFDEYGAGSAHVSAWAGIHYFASRHGFHAPGTEANERDGILTWPQGNAWLTARLAQPLGERLQLAQLITQITPMRHGVEAQGWDHRNGQATRWHARQVVLATPLFISARLLNDGSPAAQALQALRSVQRHAPWMVANLQLTEPLAPTSGAPPSWDNLIYSPPPNPHPGQPLGWVDATHQKTDPTPGPTILTAYWALGGQSLDQLNTQRQRLLNEPWSVWAQRALSEPTRVHPDLPDKIQRVDLMRYGHAMSIPTPGLRRHPALQALTQPAGRIHFAHADLGGYSVFEEAAHWGVRAADHVLSQRR